MARQEATNTWSEGMIKDLNPINTPNTALTDCLNGTIITYDGNEYSLQNDKGNYGLANAKLPVNYLPVATAEHNGIIYIISHNPIDDRVEIGSYPSPRIVANSDNDLYDAGNTKSIADVIGISKPEINNSWLISNYGETKTLQGTNAEKYKIYPGDKYYIKNITNTNYSTDYYATDTYIIDEESNLHPITLEINNESDNTFHYPSWDVPGWITIKQRFAELDDLDIGMITKSIPVYDKNGKGKTTVAFKVRTKTKDKLLTSKSNSSNISIKLELSLENSDESAKIAGSTTQTIELSNLTTCDLYNGCYAYVGNTNDLEITNISKTTSIKAKVSVKILNVWFDRLTKERSFNFANTSTITELKIGESIWNWVIDKESNSLRINFDTSGLENVVFDGDLNLRYNTYQMFTPITDRRLMGKYANDQKISNWEYSEGYNETSFTITLPESKLSAPGSCPQESIWIIVFSLYNDETPLNKDWAKLIIPSILFNSFYGTINNYDTIDFTTWVSKYKDYAKPKLEITFDDYNSAQHVSAIIRGNEDLKKSYGIDETFGTDYNYESWLNGTSDLATYEDVSGIDSEGNNITESKDVGYGTWINDTLLKSIKSGGASITYSTPFKFFFDLSIDLNLLTGPLWNDLFFNLSIGGDGTTSINDGNVSANVTINDKPYYFSHNYNLNKLLYEKSLNTEEKPYIETSYTYGIKYEADVVYNSSVGNKGIWKYTTGNLNSPSKGEIKFGYSSQFKYNEKNDSFTNGTIYYWDESGRGVSGSITGNIVYDILSNSSLLNETLKEMDNNSPFRIITIKINSETNIHAGCDTWTSIWEGKNPILKASSKFGGLNGDCDAGQDPFLPTTEAVVDNRSEDSRVDNWGSKTYIAHSVYINGNQRWEFIPYNEGDSLPEVTLINCDKNSNIKGGFTKLKLYENIAENFKEIELKPKTSLNLNSKWNPFGPYAYNINLLPGNDTRNPAELLKDDLEVFSRASNKTYGKTYVYKTDTKLDNYKIFDNIVNVHLLELSEDEYIDKFDLPFESSIVTAKPFTCWGSIISNDYKTQFDEAKKTLEKHNELVEEQYSKYASDEIYKKYTCDSTNIVLVDEDADITAKAKYLINSYKLGKNARPDDVNSKLSVLFTAALTEKKSFSSSYTISDYLEDKNISIAYFKKDFTT